jgi:hypothetical protein
MAIKMPRDGAIIFADLIGKLDVLYIHCPKCSRRNTSFSKILRTNPPHVAWTVQSDPKPSDECGRGRYRQVGDATANKVVSGPLRPKLFASLSTNNSSR